MYIFTKLMSALDFHTLEARMTSQVVDITLYLPSMKICYHVWALQVLSSVRAVLFSVLFIEAIRYHKFVMLSIVKMRSTADRTSSFKSNYP
jgi:hypothetical protein